MTARKTLVLLRHGKSGYPPGVADHERPLAERGWREALLAGDWLRDGGIEIDQVLCSTARRTRETLAASGVQAPVRFQRGLYGAADVEVLGFLTELSEDVGCALVVGHHPGMPETAEALHELAGLPPSPALEALLVKYPTSALTVVEVAADWADVATAGGEVVRFHIPR